MEKSKIFGGKKTVILILALIAVIVIIICIVKNGSIGKEADSPYGPGINKTENVESIPVIPEPELDY